MQQPLSWITDANSVYRIAIGLIIITFLWIHAALPALAKQTEGKVLATQEGKASYYSRKFDGRRTASGERFDNNHAVAAHPSWPFGTIVKVTNLANGSSLKVRVIDRGPSRRSQRKGIIIDVSRGSAKMLNFIRQGITRVRLEVLQWGKKK